MKIWAKTEEFKEGKFLVVRRDGTIPKWPHFVMGARDPYVPHALRAYADKAEEMGGDKDYADSIRELADDFDRYRADNGNGDPESPPHRDDDPAIIGLMRDGGKVMIAGATTSALDWVCGVCKKPFTDEYDHRSC